MDNRESFSDHKYISFSGGSFEPRNTELRNLNKADWKLFRQSLDMVEWPVIDDDSRVEDLAERFERWKGHLKKLAQRDWPRIKESTHGGTMSLRNHLKK